MTRRFAWPADSRPVVEVYGEIRNAARDAALKVEGKRLTNQRFDAAKTWQDLCELSAQFCEGKLPATPDHDGPRCPETVPIAAELAHANRQGFLTTCSQSGEDELWGDRGERFQQRPAVEGYASPETVRKLRALIAGTRLEMQVAEKRPQWRTDFSNGVNVTRSLWPDGAQEWHTGFGVIPSRRAHFSDLGRSDLTEGAHVVTIYDPEYGDHRLLWDRLGQPDWDSPTPPPAPVSLVKEYAGPKWLAERQQAQARRDDDDFFQRGRRICWGKPIQAWHPEREPQADEEPQMPETDADLMREARDWVSDCSWKDIDDPDDVDDLTDEEIRRGVSRHYEGGWAQFVEDARGYPAPPAETPVPEKTAAEWRANPPTTDQTTGWDGSPLNEADKRLFALREAGWTGPVDMDGHPVSPEEHEAWMARARLDPPPPAQPWTPKEPAMPVTETPGETSARSSPHSSSLWWLDGKDTSKMSFNEVTDLAGRAGDLRDEMQRRGDRPERLAEVEREYQRLLEAQQEAGRRMDERRAARADTPAPPTPPTETAVNNAVAGAIQGVSQVTPTGLVAKALSGVTGKNIKPPMAAAVESATNSSTPTGGAGMSKTEEGKQLSQQAKEAVAEAQGQTQEQVTKIDEAIAALRAAAEGSEQAEYEAAIARLEQLKEQANEVLQGCGQMPDLIDAIVW